MLTPDREEFFRGSCSFAQRRLWFLDRLIPGSSFYNIPAALRMDTQIERDVLERAVNQLAVRHESLRTTFVAQNGEPMQCIAPEPALGVVLTCVEGATAAGREAEAVRLARVEAQQPFDLEQGPLLRVGLLRLSASEHVLLVTMHHIISDGWSMEIFFRELATLYEAEREGRKAALVDLPIQYADYAVWEREWLRGERLLEQVEYWKQQLEGVPQLHMPMDRSRPAVASYRGSRELLEVNAEVTAGLKQLGQEEGTTLFMTLLAAFEVLLYRYTGQEDFTVGTLTAGRGRVETEGLIGFFVNTLALRVNLRGNPTFRELLGRVKELALEAYAHADLPFEKLVEELHPERDLSRNPLVQVTFQLFNAPRRGAGDSARDGRELPLDRAIATFDLAFDIWESGAELLGRMEYSTDLFEAATIKRVLAAFSALLAGITQDRDCLIKDLPVLTAEETRRQLVEWNATARNYPDNLCVHELFETQVTRRPHAIAVIGDREQLSFAELNSRAERIAQMLRAHGAGPDKVVGIRLPRSPEWIVAMIGVLKSGAAFLPIDPGHTAQRVEKLLQSAGAILMIGPAEGFEQYAVGGEVSPAASPNNLAYVVHTSGSTGTPKAVAVEHRALVNHALGVIERFGITPADRILQFASPLFDVSLEEVFPSLLAGAAIVLRPRGEVIPPRELVAFMRRNKITVANLPSPYWHEWVLGEACGDVPESMRLLVVGSDRTDPRLLSRWLALNGTSPRILHAYGVTECTVTSLMYEVRGDEIDLPIGRPLPNTHAYLLDGDLKPVPGGAIGDLYIGGANLARGYVQGASEAFIPSPFGPGRLYRTGDRARYLEDGNLVFAGRNDRQIKIRGFRIEPAEIESALEGDSIVRESAVLLDDESQLVAFVVSGSVISQEIILGRLRSLLPAYMLPHKILQIEEMPRTSSGKVDFAKLKRYGAVNKSFPTNRQGFAGKTEERIALIWKETLGIEFAAAEDNFFDLGGHSLALLRVHSRIEADFGRPVEVIDLFRYPTVRALARFLGGESPSQS